MLDGVIWAHLEREREREEKDKKDERKSFVLRLELTRARSEKQQAFSPKCKQLLSGWGL